MSLTLGTGGGCLLAGLLFGWFRARQPRIGQYDPAAASVIKDLGLSVFICAVGLSSGPTAVHLIQKYGASLPIAGILMTLIPACISLFLAFKLLKLPAPLGLGAVAGQQCSTPAITAIQQSAGNSTPLLSYTIVYALSNIALPILGPIVVAMVRALGAALPPRPRRWSFPVGAAPTGLQPGGCDTNRNEARRVRPSSGGGPCDRGR